MDSNPTVDIRLFVPALMRHMENLVLLNFGFDDEYPSEKLWFTWFNTCIFFPMMLTLKLKCGKLSS